MLNLFLTFLKIGTFTFGGGYAMVPLIEDELVHKQELISQDEFLDFLSIAQSYPGALAVNISVLLGYKLYKLRGSIICLLGSILPSFLIVLILSYLYFHNKKSKILDSFFYGVRPVVVSLLLYTFFNMFKNLKKTKLNITLLSISFLLVGILGLSPIYLILAGGILSLCIKY
jgi:chromate transporter